MSRVLSRCARRLVKGDRLGEERRFFVGEVGVGSDGLQLIPEASMQRVKALLWRPDGSGLTVHTDSPKQWLNLDLDGTVRVWPGLEDQPLMFGAASYSPDGRWVCAHDKLNLFLLRAGGGLSKQLTSHIFPETLPAWGDDGKLYYVHNGSPDKGAR